MAKTTVVHKREPHDVYIGRPSKWGNPFAIGPDGGRAEVIAKYREWVQKQPRLMASLHELRGKRLGCFCKPKACHGDVLRELVEAQHAADLERCPYCGIRTEEPCDEPPPDTCPKALEATRG
jgi:hypothetical protein